MKKLTLSVMLCVLAALTCILEPLKPSYAAEPELSLSDAAAIPEDFAEIILPPVIASSEGQAAADAAKSAKAFSAAEPLYSAGEESVYALYKSSSGGYAIVIRATNVVLERSESSPSPYGNAVGKKYYIGPGNYFVERSASQITNCRSGDTIDKTELYIQEILMAGIRLKYQLDFEATSGITPKSTAASTAYQITNHAKITSMPFGKNLLGSCGMVAMGQLLQYYDEYSVCSGTYLPDTFDYRTHPDDDETAQKAAAERLHQELIALTPQHFLSFFGETLTMPGTQKTGLENYRTQYAPNAYTVNTVHNEGVWITLAAILVLTAWPPGLTPTIASILLTVPLALPAVNIALTASDIVHAGCMSYISNDKPCILTMLFFDDGTGLQNGIGGHTVIAYGYDTGTGQILAHNGWDDIPTWFSALFYIGIVTIEDTSVHSFMRTPKDVYSHTVSCTKCAYQKNEVHTYMDYNDGYRCRFCGFFTRVKPVTLLSGQIAYPDCCISEGI